MFYTEVIENVTLRCVKDHYEHTVNNIALVLKDYIVEVTNIISRRRIKLWVTELGIYTYVSKNDLQSFYERCDDNG